jgi:tRNA-dihydrouridine synthase
MISSVLPRVSVAPMEGFTTFPMRLWLFLCSEAETMTTPFLRITRVHPEGEIPADFAPELFELRNVLPYSLTPQFITGDHLQFLRAADLMPEHIASVLELNCGCPSPNSLGRLAGSGMLHDADAFGRSIEDLTRELGPDRISIKMRLGIDTADEFPALLNSIMELPLARLSVHGRTRSDGYRGHARWESIQMAAARAKTPVIASGDILGIHSLRSLQSVAPGVQGAMIGRGVLRNPWVFEEIRTGKAVEIDLFTFLNALFCYALLQDLWQNHPMKLIARVANGRIGNPCRNDFAAWEKLTVELTSLVFGVPFLLTPDLKLPFANLSPVAFSRLKILWSYLRSGLPECFGAPALTRAKDYGQFFEKIVKAADDLESESFAITHNPDWDQHFAGARG